MTEKTEKPINPKTCADCIHYDVCQAVWETYGISKVTPSQCECFKDKSRYIELPCAVGSEVFVSPNRGKNFHKAKIYGCDEKGVWLVLVNDNLLTNEDKHIVANPMRKIFYDWFLKVYSKEDAEKALKGGAE